MAYVKVTQAKKAKRVIDYVMNGDAKENQNGVMDRVLSASGQNVLMADAESVDSQFKALRELSGREDKRQQIFHSIQSFTRNEFDVNNPDDVARVNELGKQLASEIGGERSQFIVITHGDNRNGLLHNHIVHSSLLTNGKTLQTSQFTVSNVRQMNDAIMERNGYMQPVELTEGTKRGKVSIAEQEIGAKGQMTNSAILQSRIDKALESSVTMKEFEASLNALEIDLQRGKRKGEEIFKFKFQDPTIERRAFTDRKLGVNYSKQGIERVLEYKEARQKQIENERLVNVQPLRQEPQVTQETQVYQEIQRVVRQREDEEKERKREVDLNEGYDWGTDDIAPNYHYEKGARRHEKDNLSSDFER